MCFLQDEKQRIEALGGCVIWFGTWRVNGSLSVSRAIGNYQVKYFLLLNQEILLVPFKPVK